MEERCRDLQARPGGANLDEAAAKQLAGVLGTPVPHGRRRTTHTDLDAALRETAAAADWCPSSPSSPARSADDDPWHTDR